MKIFIVIIAAFIIFFGCSEKRNELDVDSHPEEWVEINGNNFHGNYVIINGLQSCRTCHGEQYDGGTSNVSCKDCHNIYPHDEEFALITSNNFHGHYIKNNGWDMSECQSCHGNAFNLPSTEQSCLACHTSPGGPLACHTCHGSLTNNAPPRDLSGSVEPSQPGVGAHQIHVGVSEFTDNMACSSCHLVDYDYYAATHIDGDDQAEIIFDDLSTASGSVNPTYEFNNFTCSNVYCHGNFSFLKSESDNSWAYENDADAMVGLNPDVIWTVVDGSQIACGSCHGLPPEGHKPFNGVNCSNCHSTVVDEDLNIIDKTLHINGEIDYTPL